MAIDFVQLGTVAGLVGLGVWNGAKEYKQYRKAKMYNLQDNPDRCNDHEQRLRSIETCAGQIKTDVAVVQVQIEDLQSDMDKVMKKVGA